MRLGKSVNLLKNAIWIIRLALKRLPRLTTLLIVFSIASGIIPAAIAAVGRQLINAVEAGGSSFDIVAYWLIISLIFATLLAFFRLGESYFSSRSTQELQYIVDETILEHAAMLELAHFESPALQDVIARAQQSMGMHVAKFLNTLVTAGSAIIQAVSITIVLVAIDPVALVLLPFIIPNLGFQVYIARLRYNKEYKRASQRRWSKYFTDLMMGRDSVPEIKIYNLSQVLIGQFNKIARQIIGEDQRILRLNAGGNLLLEVLFQAVYYGVFAFAAWRVFNGTMTIGDLTVYVAATAQLRQSLQNVSKALSTITEDTLYVSDLIELLDVEPNQTQPRGDSEAPISGDIELRNITFQYPESARTVLKNVSLHIQPGEIIAIVGENGAGKSTLVKLIANLYDPQTGCILFDGQDITDLSLKYFYQQIAYVPQVFNRYEATVADNIAFGNWELMAGDQALIEETARLAEIDRLVEKMPQQYQTMLGRKFGEYDLSTGQWQRVIIARAFARRDAPILILDEPTASLDAQAEYDLFSKIRELAQGRTTLFVSHRFGTVRMADRIIVMHDGQIVEDGTHEALLAENGYYAKLYNIQSSMLA
ncbi:MAG: ABC transporter ATP-binding protein/permease [Anaerolineae bacterium]|nr:ABC transporter ATP-binding protein/permease [Anaerolineae bacterium]